MALAGSSLISSDEGRYASLSLSMLQSGDWITPRLNGLLYFEKPPLQYWMGAIAMRSFGVNEFAARLWPGLAGLATVALLGHTARRLWGASAGWRALCIGASTTWIAVNSHFLSLDAGLCAALTLVLSGLLIAEHSRKVSPQSARRWILAAWVGLALAVLSKGPIGVVTPAVVLMLQSAWRRDFSVWSRLQWVPGLLIFGVIAVPWFVMISAKNPGFASFFFVHEHIDRFLTPVHRREGSWWYFLPFVLVGFLPWTGALPWLVRSTKGDFATSLLVIWCVFILLFFSASSSKLPSYILPMFPALVLLLVRALDRASPIALRRHFWVPVVVWGLTLLCVPFASRFGKGAPPAAVESLALGVTIGAALFLGTAPLAWRLLSRGNLTATLAALSGAHLAALLIVMASYNPYGQLKSSDALVRALTPAIDPQTPVFAVRLYDHTLPFYLRRPVILVEHVDEFEFGESQEPARWIPTLDQFVLRWRSEPRAAAYMNRATFDELLGRGLAMRVQFEDARRLVVVKP